MTCTATRARTCAVIRGAIRIAHHIRTGSGMKLRGRVCRGAKTRAVAPSARAARSQDSQRGPAGPTCTIRIPRGARVRIAAAWEAITVVAA